MALFELRKAISHPDPALDVVGSEHTAAAPFGKVAATAKSDIPIAGDSDRGCGKMLAKERAGVNVGEYPTVEPPGAWARDAAQRHTESKKNRTVIDAHVAVKETL